MNDEQKRIEEMAKDLEEARDYAMTTVGSLNNGFGGWYGAYMYKKGYRKQSDTAKEILQKLIYNITANNTNDGYLSESIDYSSTIDDIKELAAQYGVELPVKVATQFIKQTRMEQGYSRAQSRT